MESNAERIKMREDAFYKRIIPPLKITDNELDRSDMAAFYAAVARNEAMEKRAVIEEGVTPSEKPANEKRSDNKHDQLADHLTTRTAETVRKSLENKEVK